MCRIYHGHEEKIYNRLLLSLTASRVLALSTELKENHVIVCIDNRTDRSSSSATHHHIILDWCSATICTTHYNPVQLMCIANIFYLGRLVSIHVSWDCSAAKINSCRMNLKTTDLVSCPVPSSCLDWHDQYFTSTIIIPDCRCINYEDRLQNYSLKCTEAQGRTWQKTLAHK